MRPDLVLDEDDKKKRFKKFKESDVESNSGVEFIETSNDEEEDDIQIVEYVQGKIQEI